MPLVMVKPVMVTVNFGEVRMAVAAAPVPRRR